MPRKKSGNPDDWDFRFLVFSERYDLHFKDLTAKIIDDTILI